MWFLQNLNIKLHTKIFIFLLFESQMKEGFQEVSVLTKIVFLYVCKLATLHNISPIIVDGQMDFCLAKVNYH